MNNNKKRIFNSSRFMIIVIMLIVVVVGGTFAWFSYQSRKSALVLSIGDINDSKVIIKPYHIRETMTPVNTYTSGVYSQVTVNNNNTNKFSLVLRYKINQLDDVLINNGLKYTIASSDSINGEYTEIKTGDFLDINDNSIEILRMNITPEDTEYYRVYLWLDSSVGDQTLVENSFLDIELNGFIESTANAPMLDDGMIPVVISDDGTVKTIKADNSNWYDYNKKKWANIVLVNSSSRDTYLNTEDVVVAESDILAYYVWIPRYKYKVWTTSMSSTGNEQSIGIVFESKDEPMVNGTTVGSFRTHPAFWWDENSDGVYSDNEMISGIWVGKFETTGDATTPTVKPNVQSLRNQNVSTQFQTSLKFAGGTMNTSIGAVSFSGNNTYGLTKDSDSHMMKNSEWGAVAYLSHSQYGINEEIYINNSSGFYTGRSGGNVGEQTDTSAYGTYGLTGQVMNSDGTYGTVSDSTLGTMASTTGNVTGVYDMSGGAWEYVMGVLSDSSGNPRSGYSSDRNSGFNGIVYDNTSYTSGIEFPNSKYYDLYLQSQFNGDYSTNFQMCTLETCGGHALNETANWYNDYAVFVDSEHPWFLRGGDWDDDVYAGAFGVGDSSGNDYDAFSWRSVIISKNIFEITYDLNGGELENIETMNYTSSGEHQYVAPVDGEYQLEVWGAQGGTSGLLSTAQGGYGGYSVGTVLLNANEKLYVNVGGKGINGDNSNTTKSGGYNGGGTKVTPDANYYSSSGGGATHIALKNGLLSTLSSDIDKILIVAGGGGGGAGITDNYGVGGHAGGFTGGSGTNIKGNVGWGSGGTQTTGGCKTGISGNGLCGQFGLGNSESSGHGGAGGGGFYGGGSTNDGYIGGGGGGSGYIGNNLLTNKAMYCYNCTTSSDLNTLTYTTTDASSTAISNYAKSGDGAARITFLSHKKYVDYLGKYGNLPTPKKDENKFIGWTTVKDDINTLVTSESIVNIIEDHTLYALFAPIYTVIFDLNGGKTDESFKTINYTTSGEHVYTVPYNAKYKLEVWGAQGGNVTGGTNGGTISTITPGYGGYSVGTVTLNKDSNLYINVGGKGTDNCVSTANGTVVSCAGGYNGGGTAYSSDYYRYTSSGGGATHIADNSGTLSSLSSNKESILIVAGGGGGSSYYNYNSAGIIGNGGSGGGFIGNNGIISSSLTTISLGGTQSSGFGFGLGETPVTDTNNNALAGGGGGYYGGYSEIIKSGVGGGGSGYIGNNLLTNKFMYCYNCTTSGNVETLTYSTINVSDAATSNYAKSGNGAARITLLFDTKKVTYLEKYGELPTPTRDFSTFVGWNTKSDGTGEFVNSDTIVSEIEGDSLYLYAIWDNREFNVIYSVNGGVIDSTTISNDGNTTYNWTTNNDIIFLNGNSNFYNVDNLNIINLYNYNNLNYMNISKSGAGVPNDKEWICLEGCKVENSVYSQNIQYKYSDFCDENSESCNIVLGVNWKQIYSVNYDANGGDVTPDSQQKLHDEDLKLSIIEPKKLGYTFLGWATSSDATSAQYSAGGSYTANSGTTLYAVWRTSRVNINYNANGGTFTNGTSNNTFSLTNDIVYMNGTLYTDTILYGNTIGSSGLTNYNYATNFKISKTGYTPPSGAEWICSSGCTTASKTYGQDINTYVSDDFCDASYGDCTVVLKVNWKINTYTVSYNANGGSGAPSSQTKTHGTALTLSSTKPKKLGYTFLGWATSSTATSAQYSAGGSYTANSGTTLYAVWRTSRVNINLHVNGGTITSSTTADNGSVFNWTTSNGLIYVNTKLYTMTINYNASNNIANYSNSKYIQIKRTGYTPPDGAEWICHSGCTTANKTYDQDVNYNSADFCDASYGDCTVVLKVNWKAITVKVTFNKNDGSGKTVSQTFTYGVSGNRFGYNTDGTPKWGTSGDFGSWTNSGYYLAGWSKSKPSGMMSFDYTPYNNVSNNWIINNAPSITLYAVWVDAGDEFPSL